MEESKPVENIANYYLEQLKNNVDPAITLAKFYWELFSKSPESKDIVMFKKLVRVYGRDDVYMSILDLTSVKDLNLDSPYGIFNYICKSKVEKRLKGVSEPDYTLEKRAEELKKELNKRKRIEIRSPFNER